MVMAGPWPGKAKWVVAQDWGEQNQMEMGAVDLVLISINRPWTSSWVTGSPKVRQAKEGLELAPLGSFLLSRQSGSLKKRCTKLGESWDSKRCKIKTLLSADQTWKLLMSLQTVGESRRDSTHTLKKSLIITLTLNQGNHKRFWLSLLQCFKPLTKEWGTRVLFHSLKKEITLED